MHEQNGTLRSSLLLGSPKAAPEGGRPAGEQGDAAAPTEGTALAPDRAQAASSAVQAACRKRGPGLVAWLLWQHLTGGRVGRNAGP